MKKAKKAAKKTAKKFRKVHDYLAKEVDSHGIYDAKAIAKDFEKQTGKKACWPVFTASEVHAAIKRRGVGGSLRYDSPAQLMASGFDIAESCAEKYANSHEHRKFEGRGKRFWTAVEALKQEKV